MLLTCIESIARRIWNRNLFFRLPSLTYLRGFSDWLNFAFFCPHDVELEPEPESPFWVMAKVDWDCYLLLSCTPFFSTLLEANKQENL